MRHRRSTHIPAALLSVALLGSGCGGRDETTIADSKPYNDADVTFATQMIQHHAQALEMVDLTLGRDLDPQVATLAEEIRTVQAPEIEQMVDLLGTWDNQPVPATSRDHANAHGDGSDGATSDPDVPGMMSAQDMRALEAAKGDAFQTRWLTMMVEHHQGAIDVATTEKDDGEDKRATALAATIVNGQEDQVEQMRGLLEN